MIIESQRFHSLVFIIKGYSIKHNIFLGPRHSIDEGVIFPKHCLGNKTPIECCQLKCMVLPTRGPASFLLAC